VADFVVGAPHKCVNVALPVANAKTKEDIPLYRLETLKTSEVVLRKFQKVI
jgi:hypothetical protein